MKLITIAAIAVCAMLTGCAGFLENLPDVPDVPDPQPSTTTTVTTTTTTTTTAAVPNGAYRITHVSANKIAWTGPDLPWRTGGSGDVVKSANAEGHLYLENGQGGKWDWIRPNTKERDFKNVNNGTYGVWRNVQPRRGETVTFQACNRHDLSERITIGTFKWVR